jgi:hypothetical protein
MHFPSFFLLILDDSPAGLFPVIVHCYLYAFLPRVHDVLLCSYVERFDVSSGFYTELMISDEFANRNSDYIQQST